MREPACNMSCDWRREKKDHVEGRQKRSMPSIVSIHLAGQNNHTLDATTFPFSSPPIYAMTFTLDCQYYTSAISPCRRTSLFGISSSLRRYEGYTHAHHHGASMVQPARLRSFSRTDAHLSEPRGTWSRQTPHRARDQACWMLGLSVLRTS